MGHNFTPIKFVINDYTKIFDIAASIYSPSINSYTDAMIFNWALRDNLFALKHIDSNSIVRHSCLTFSELTREVISFPLICTDVSSAYMFKNIICDLLFSCYKGVVNNIVFWANW